MVRTETIKSAADKKRGRQAKLLAALVLLMLAITVLMNGENAFARDVEWGRFQGREDNNGITDIRMSAGYSESALKWGRQLQPGYTTSFTPPLIIDGYLYTASNMKVYKINKETGVTVKESLEMENSVQYAMHPMTYDEDHDQMYVPLMDGRVACVDAETLGIKWQSKPYKGFQSLQPIAYKNGRVYNGTWETETGDGVFYCLDAETGATLWEFRPSEQETHTVAQQLPEFPAVVGDLKPNYYTYTALVQIRAKDGYLFGEVLPGAYYLFKNVMPGNSDNPQSKGWYEFNESEGLYVETKDQVVDTNKPYYQKESFTQVSPNGSENPKEKKWYEYNGNYYQATKDETVKKSKSYYKNADIAFSINGHSTTIDYDKESETATLRARFNYSGGTFTQFGAEKNAGLQLAGLDAPVVGNAFDTTIAASDAVDLVGVEWKTGDAPHGFYWAGAYTNGEQVFFGSDDGQENTFGGSGDESYTNTAVFYSLDCDDGRVIDRIDGCKGDIRSTAVFANGFLYFTTKGGRLYKAKVNADGTFNHSQVSFYQVPSMMTASPVVYNGRIYVGIAGMGGQFDADGGHLFGVFRDDLRLHNGESDDDSGSLIYTTQVKGYPQASPLLSTNTAAGGNNVKLYFTYNAPPGGLYYMDDSPSLTQGEAKMLFIPEEGMRQYSLTPICVDREGTMYLKNDSGYMMAVAMNRAWADDISVKYDNTEIEWEGGFESGTLNYKLRAPNEASEVGVTVDLPDGVTAELAVQHSESNGTVTYLNRQPYTGGSQTVALPEDPDVDRIAVITSKTEGGKTYTRTYALKIVPDSNNANLAGIVVNTSNSVPGNLSSIKALNEQIRTETDEEARAALEAQKQEKVAGLCKTGTGYDPTFETTMKKYVSKTYSGTKRAINVWFIKEDQKATVRAYPVSNVGNNPKLGWDSDSMSLKVVNSNGSNVFYVPVYWVKGEISAEIRIEVTSPSGKAVDSYNMELVRDHGSTDVGEETVVLDKSTASLNTRGGNTTTSVIATYKGTDVTNKCVWESSRPDVATVDGNGNIAAGTNQGEAVIWARYGALENAVRVTVTAPRAVPPVSSVAQGTYQSRQNVYLSTTSIGAEIRYNIGNTEDVKKPTMSTGTVYDEESPIVLGVDGQKTFYRIRAVACNNGYTYDPDSDIRTFDYTIDLRNLVTGITVTGLDAPAAGAAFDTDASAEEEGVEVTGVRWYEEDESGGLTEVSGTAEENKDYVALLDVAADTASARFDEHVTASEGGRARSVTYNSEGSATVRCEYRVGKTVRSIEIDGVNKPEPQQAFDASANVITEGLVKQDAYWTDAEGTKQSGNALFDTEYDFNVVVKEEEGYDLAAVDRLTATIKKDGRAEQAEIIENADGTLTIRLGFRTRGLRVSKDPDNLTVDPAEITGLKNGTTEAELREALNAVSVKVKMEDGSEKAVGVHWKAEPKSAGTMQGDIEYDPNDIRAQEFIVSGSITGLSEEELDGLVLTPQVRVKVNKGKVSDPEFTPASKIYTSDQYVTITSRTPGAVIYYTRSDGEKTDVYSEPILISCETGKVKTVTFKAFAEVHGVQSGIVTYTIEVNKKNVTPPDSMTPAKARKLTVKGLKVTCKKRRFTVTWKKTAKATGYRVLYKLKTAKKWKILKTTTARKAVTKKLKKGKRYRFRVRTYTTIKKTRYFGKLSAIVTKKCRN